MDIIPLAKPYLGDKEAEAAGEAIRSGWVTQGKRVEAFEEAFASYVGSKYACAVSNCTNALHLSLLVVGVKPGDVVITVSHSFIATANSVRCCMAEPVFVDIDLQTYNICPQQLNKLLEDSCEIKNGILCYKDTARLTCGESPLVYIDEHRRGRVAAIIAVHQLGMPCDLSSIINIAQEYNLPVIEDAACALGSEIYINDQWEKIGKPHGDVACFSFHPRKMITTGDGGMITTSRDEHYHKFKLLRNQGMSMSASERRDSREVVVEKYLVTAFNSRLTDIQAAVGIIQLQQLDMFIEKRQNVNQLYRQYFKDINWLSLPYEPEYAHTNWQTYPVRVLKNAPFLRDDLIQHLFDNDIASIPGVMNAHQTKPYDQQNCSLPNSECARKEVIMLPFYVDLNENDVKRIADVLAQIETKV